MNFYELLQEHSKTQSPFTNVAIEKAAKDIGTILNGFTVQEAAIILGLAQNHLWAAQVRQSQD